MTDEITYTEKTMNTALIFERIPIMNHNQIHECGRKVSCQRVYFTLRLRNIRVEKNISNFLTRTTKISNRNVF